MTAQDASVLFVPTNNGLPERRASADLVAEARCADMARAVENRMWVVRADVGGHNGELMSYGSSGIVDPDGHAVQQAQLQSADLVIADMEIAPA